MDRCSGHKRHDGPNWPVNLGLDTIILVEVELDEFNAMRGPQVSIVGLRI